MTDLSGHRDWSIGTSGLVYRDSVTGLSGQGDCMVYRDSVTGLSGQRDWSVGTVRLVYRDSVTGLSGHSVTGLWGHSVTGVSGTLHTRGHLLKRFENCIHVACVFEVSVQTSRTRGLFMSHCIFFLTTVQVISSECLSVLLLAQMSSTLTASRRATSGFNHNRVYTPKIFYTKIAQSTCKREGGHESERP